MNKRSIFVIVAVSVVALFLAAGIQAGNQAPDVIKMENPAYKKHKKGIVEFSHNKHTDDYGAACGDCHHDEDGKPLTELKDGDEVDGCIECHSNPGQKPKGKGAPKLSKKEELEYHAEALHDNCKGCHKQHNKKNKTKAAPTTCSKCHPKKKKIK